MNDTPVTGTDFYPTILAACGLPARPEQHLDGVSLLPLLKGKTIAERPLFWHYPHYSNQGGEPVSMILEGDWTCTSERSCPSRQTMPLRHWSRIKVTPVTSQKSCAPISTTSIPLMFL